MAAMATKSPELRDVMLQLAAIDPLVALDVACLSEYLLRAAGVEPAPRLAASAASGGKSGSVAIIPVHGALYPRGGRSLYGSFTGMDGLRSQVAAHAADPDVSAIIAHFDSPGGTVAGTPETAAAFKAAATQKPVIAMVDSLAASAAYWIASQCSEIVMAPSADVGSIGAMILHADVSDALSQMGVKMTMIRSAQSPQKNEAHPFAPLSDDARSFLQGRVDEAGTDFIKAVASGRRVTQAKVRDEFGQGRVYGAKDALSRGMVDRVATLDDVVGGLQQKRAATGRRRSAFLFE
jgi:signal peptide peptidase SppA